MVRQLELREVHRKDLQIDSEYLLYFSEADCPEDDYWMMASWNGETFEFEDASPIFPEMVSLIFEGPTHDQIIVMSPE